MAHGARFRISVEAGAAAGVVVAVVVEFPGSGNKIAADLQALRAYSVLGVFRLCGKGC